MFSVITIMKIERKYMEFGKYYFVLDDNREPIGTIADSDVKMVEWLEDNDLWSNGDDIEVKTKHPIVKTGTMVYYIDDPEKEPYRWKVWDDAERESMDYDFIDPNEANYTFKLKLPWD